MEIGARRKFGAFFLKVFLDQKMTVTTVLHLENLNLGSDASVCDFTVRKVLNCFPKGRFFLVYF